MVVRTWPVHRATAVDPVSVTDLRVEFDRDMSVGDHSWVGGGEAFPQLRGNPYWVGPRMAVLPVRLKPNHRYDVGLNSARYRSFRSADGEVLSPQPLVFSTGSARSVSPELLTELNRRSVFELLRLIDEEYSYRDLRGVDWAALFAEQGPELEAGRSTREFAEKAVELLGHAKDLHVTVALGNEVLGTHKREVRVNADVGPLSRTVPNWRQENKAVCTGEFENGIGYILIANWSRELEDELDAASAALRRFATGRGVIIDVRFNSGGDESLASRFAGLLVDSPRPYAMHTVRNAYLPGGFARPTTRVLAPSDSPVGFSGKVAVLMGPANMSSCEAFLLMMKQVPRCRLFGERSYGSSGNPKRTELANGVAIMLPSWKAMTLEGKTFEGVGIEPDARIGHADNDRNKVDATLEAALLWLRN